MEKEQRSEEEEGGDDAISITKLNDLWVFAHVLQIAHCECICL